MCSYSTILLFDLVSKGNFSLRVNQGLFNAGVFSPTIDRPPPPPPPNFKKEGGCFYIETEEKILKLK